MRKNNNVAASFNLQHSIVTFTLLLPLTIITIIPTETMGAYFVFALLLGKYIQCLKFIIAT